ncbi:MAG: hypothetical protein GXO50_02960 [Chlorobi bacterium]|nr:hypothetical protein [Chlorobiota bacterium]
MKKYVFVIVSLFLAFNLNAQTPEEIFKNKYPELFTELKTDGSVKVTADNIQLFRDQYKKLKDGLDEIEMFKFGGASEDNLNIFEYKELKNLQKENKLAELETLLKNKVTDLKLFLGQNDQYGVDKKECLMTYSNLKQSLKRKDYDAAFEFWREMYKYYPKFKNAYSKGDVLVRTKIKEVTGEAAKLGKAALEAQNAKKYDEAKKLAEQQKQTVAERELWIDTLLMIYDQRMKYLGNDKYYGTGYLKGKKGGYIYKYRKDSALSQAYGLLKESVESEKEKSNFAVVKDFFDAAFDMIKAGKIGADELVADYNLSTDVLKKNSDKMNGYIEKEQKKKSPNKSKIENWKKVVKNNEKVSKYITKKFASSDYSKCEYLVPAFSSSFEKNKNDKEWLKTVTGILSWKDCTNDDFYGQAAEALYKLEPSANSAFKLALFYLKKENYEDAAKYFEDAYKQETDSDKKAEYYYYAAVVAYAQNKLSYARSLALKAAGLKEKYGKPYILIAKMYAGSANSCGTTKFEKQAVYWVAVDKLIKAKSIDPSVAEEADRLIAKYSARYPSQEEGFMLTWTAGKTYTVGCWIGESTKVRY